MPFGSGILHNHFGGDPVVFRNVIRSGFFCTTDRRKNNLRPGENNKNLESDDRDPILRKDDCQVGHL